MLQTPSGEQALSKEACMTVLQPVLPAIQGLGAKMEIIAVGTLPPLSPISPLPSLLRLRQRLRDSRILSALGFSL